MFLDTITLLILAAYLYVLFTMIGKEDYSSMLILTLVVCIVLCWRRRGGFIEGFHPSEMAYLDSNSPQNQDSMPKHFASVVDSIAKKQQPKVQNTLEVNNDPGLLYNNVSAYDGLCLKTGNKEYWMKSPDETSLVPNDNLYTYLSSQGPIKMKISDQNNLIGPPVDGVEGSPKKMFMWANNLTRPLCCPSTFSTST